MTLVRVLSRWVSRAESGRRASSSPCDAGAGEAEAPSASAEASPGRASRDGGRMSSGGSGDTGAARIAGGRKHPCKTQRARRNVDPCAQCSEDSLIRPLGPLGAFPNGRGAYHCETDSHFEDKGATHGFPPKPLPRCAASEFFQRARARGTDPQPLEAASGQSDECRRALLGGGQSLGPAFGEQCGPDRSRSGTRFGNYFPLKARTFFRHGLRGGACVLSQGPWEG